MRSKHIVLLVLMLPALFTFIPTRAAAAQQPSGRLLFITLIPNYAEHSIQFNGQSVLGLPTAALDLAGLPFQVKQKWKDGINQIWNMSGTILHGRLALDAEQNVYHLY